MCFFTSFNKFLRVLTVLLLILYIRLAIVYIKKLGKEKNKIASI